MSRADFTGTGYVFTFTLQQHFKNTATRVLLIILAVLAVAAVPVASLVLGHSAPHETKIAALYIKNDTPYSITSKDISEQDDMYSMLDIHFTTQSVEEIRSGLTGYDALVHMSYSNEDAAYVLTAYARPRDTVLEEAELSALTGVVSAALRRAQIASSGAGEDALAVLSGGFSTSVSRWRDFAREDRVSPGARYAVTYIYAILVIMLSVFSCSYIVHAVIEEKSSMLVELLMISVRPLALILGKILALVVAMFSVLLGTAALVVASYLVTGLFRDVSFVASYIENSGLTGSLGNLNLSVIAIALFSLVLAYLLFALIGGLMGTSCSTQEEEGAATTGVMLLVMVGYFYAILYPVLGSQTVLLIGVFCPVLSAFCAPVAYVCAEISLWMLCLSWLIQIVVLAAVASFTARVYSALLMYRGKRVGLKQLFALAKGAKGGVRA